MINPALKRAQLNREAVLSASPARLLTMLYDRLLVDLNRAQIAQNAGNWPVAAENLVHAQDIISELSASLNDGVWDGASGLRGIYTFVARHLAEANIKRDAALTGQIIELMEPLRQVWHEAAAAPATHRPDVHVG
ncbi:flagellar export chaperone FliS [Glutamicibacter creatinolyticus]|uniref:flagellar export chaperone FliS n=1 Tax=Glutamicibacter creatinolyticus TaxID=162496 RepID=UPI003216C4F8